MKGTAIKVKHGSSIDEVVNAVREKYAEARATAKGWHGTAVVNVEADENGKNASTYLVKGTKSGFEVFGFLGAVEDKVVTKAGKFEPAS
jgi:hypothetical protein